MTPELFFPRIVEPTLQWMSASPSIHIPVTDIARILTMTIAGQESNWQYRRQINGPARSYWQFEKGGGAAGLFNVLPAQLEAVCRAFDIPYDLSTVFEAMAWNDTLGCAMARLLLWDDPNPLPAVGDKEAGWQYYLRNWRPGAPHRESWDGLYDKAVAAIH